jgi:hypothetical protein
MLDVNDLLQAFPSGATTDAYVAVPRAPEALRDLEHRLSAGEAWSGHDEAWLESLIAWRCRDLALTG